MPAHASHQPGHVNSSARTLVHTRAGLMAGGAYRGGIHTASWKGGHRLGRAWGQTAPSTQRPEQPMRIEWHPDTGISPWRWVLSTSGVAAHAQRDRGKGQKGGCKMVHATRSLSGAFAWVAAVSAGVGRVSRSTSQSQPGRSRCSGRISNGRASRGIGDWWSVMRHALHQYRWYQFGCFPRPNRDRAPHARAQCDWFAETRRADQRRRPGPGPPES